MHHALAVAVPRAALNRLAPGGLNWVWPALSADDGNGPGYSSTGDLYMGSLLAIPAGFDLSSLGLQSSDPMAYQIAWSLQNYGAYVVDCSSDNMDFFVDGNSSLASQGLPDDASRTSISF